MASPKRQPKPSLAQPIKGWPGKKEIAAILKQFHRESTKLKPVRFAYYPDTEAKEVLSLPMKAGEILAAEQLITVDGAPIATNRKKLEDPVFKRHLETKIFLALADTAIHSKYKEILYPVSQIKELRNLKLFDRWNIGVNLILDELSREGAIVFTNEIFGHHLIGQKLPSLPELESANQAVKETVGKYIAANLNEFSQFLGHFLRPINQVKDADKQKILEVTAETIQTQIPKIDPIGLVFTVSLDPKFFPGVNLNYPDLT